MDKTISLDSLQRLIIMPLKRLIDKKVTMVDDKGLSTNDFTNEEKEKLAGLKGVPESTGEWKQLVTDNEGNVVWEDRLAHDASRSSYVLAEGQTYDLMGIQGIYEAVFYNKTPVVGDAIVATFEGKVLRYEITEEATSFIFGDDDKKMHVVLDTQAVIFRDLSKTGGYVKIEHEYVADPVPIDPKFLPDGIGYKAKEIISVSWDGAITGKTSYTIGEYIYYKASSLVLSNEMIKKGKAVFSSGSSVRFEDVWSDMVDSGYITDDFAYTELFVCIRKENVEAMGTVFPEPGLYFYYSDHAFVMNFRSSLENIHAIPSVYFTGEEPGANKQLITDDSGKAVWEDKTPGSSSGLPEGGGTYKHLVIDGEGKAVWEDRLALYSRAERYTLAEGEVNQYFSFNTNVVYKQTPQAGDTFYITYDDEEHTYSVTETDVANQCTPELQFDDGCWFCAVWSDDFKVVYNTYGKKIPSHVKVEHSLIMYVKVPVDYIPDEIIVGVSGEGVHSSVFNDTKINKATGEYSHAEGQHTTASGRMAHAEGNNTVASGSIAHAEGVDTVASAAYSHAEGWKTQALGIYQHVQGKANIADPEGKYAHIVGNGTGTYRYSNAHTLDWDGNAWFAGNVKVGGTNQDDENARELLATPPITESDNGKVLGVVDGKIRLVEIVDTTARQEITQLSEGKVDKTYVVELFEELKELILSGNTSGAIALLDQAVLDQAVLS